MRAFLTGAPRAHPEARQENNLELTNYENVSYRDDRLRKCARLAALVFGITEEQLDALIVGLHDYKGTLWVRWQHKPSVKAQQVLQSVWEACAEYCVTHVWPGHEDWDSALTFRD